MGNEEIRIKYANKQEYLGSTKENIPEGNGKILVKKRSLFEEKKIARQIRANLIFLKT